MIRLWTAAGRVPTALLALLAVLCLTVAGLSADAAGAKAKRQKAATAPAAARQPAVPASGTGAGTEQKTQTTPALTARQASAGNSKPGGHKPGGGKPHGGGNSGGESGGGSTSTPTTTTTTTTTTTSPTQPAPLATTSTVTASQEPASATATPTRRTRRTASSGAKRRSAGAAARRRTSGGLGDSGALLAPAELDALGSTPLEPLAAADRSAKKAAAGSAPEQDNSPRATVTRTVRDIVEVVPQAVKLLLGALAALSIVLAGGYLLTAARARRLHRQRADLLQEVGLLQTALLPPVPATVGAMRTSVAYRPSDGPGAGGDFYDALTLPGGRAAFLLGDVSGHGRQALARTAFIRYTLRAYIEAGLEPRLALQLAGPVIDEHLGGDFATVVLAIHDPLGGTLTYACAGHPAPIVVGTTRPEPILAASSPPIGLGMRTGVRQTCLPLPPGSVVCLYTDGLAEARTRTGILGRPRLADILAELGRDATAPGLLDRVAAEARLLTDDMATVVLSPTAGVTTGGFREERLEVDLDEVRAGLAGRFLEACGVGPPRLTGAIDEAKAWADSHGAAVIHVCFGVRGPTVEVVARNVESLEAASRRRALA